VPEIIAFSNQLSYNGTIRPLRETNSSNLKPACIPYRVHGIRENSTNTTEAETIVSVIEAMIKHPAYNGKTIGVISMVGEPQAIKIETLLHKRIDSVEIQKRRIQAGISAQFQGDERDVIFLSFIDSQGEEGYMRAMGEGAFELMKKRFNVATSRARDQLWAVYSFDPDRHLKADDMRLKLLQHMKDPWAAVNAYSNEVGKTDSDFERQVLKRNGKWDTTVSTLSLKVTANALPLNVTETATTQLRNSKTISHAKLFWSVLDGSSCAFAVAPSTGHPKRR
jgi:hypothetical protein